MLVMREEMNWGWSGIEALWRDRWERRVMKEARNRRGMFRWQVLLLLSRASRRRWGRFILDRLRWMPGYRVQLEMVSMMRLEGRVTRSRVTPEKMT